VHKNNHLGFKLSVIARSLDITQQDLSKNTNINRTSLSNFFNGKTQLQSDNLFKLLDMLNINFDSLIDLKVDQAMKRDNIETAGQLFDSLLKIVPHKHKKRNAIQYIKSLAKQCESNNPKAKYIHNALLKVTIYIGSHN
jgi:transcriptional regulator with XRE-family HTH domain